MDPQSASKADYEELMAQAASQIEAVRGLGEQVADVRGEGEVADGKVRAMVQQGGKLDELEIDPRAMRMQSHELAEAVMEAIRLANEDAAAKVGELMESAIPGAGFPIVSLTDPEEVAKGHAASEEKINSIVESLKRGFAVDPAGDATGGE